MYRTCVFEQWSAKQGTMVKCGRKAVESVGDKGVCADHFTWHTDCTGTWSKRKGGRHPSTYNWLKKAKAAYGVKAGWPLPLPSDRGANYICGRRIERRDDD